MFKYATFAALMVSAAAVSAQVTPASGINPVTAEKTKSNQSDQQYCIYEDKKYTEGAIKKADGVVMVCMRENGFATVSYPGAPSTVPPLVWEPATSARGREKLNLKSSSDVFK